MLPSGFRAALLLSIVMAAGCKSTPLSTLPSLNPGANGPLSPPAAGVSAGVSKSAGYPTAPVSTTRLVSTEEIPAPGPEEVPEVLDPDLLALEVQARNPSLQAMVFAWQAASKRYPQVVSLDDPMFMAMLAPESVSSPVNETAYVLEASQKVPWHGKRALRGERATAEAQMSGAEAEDFRYRLIETARNAFLEYYLVYQLRELNQSNLALLQTIRSTVQIKYRANLVGQQDLLQADVEVAEFERKQIELDRALEVSKARINTLLSSPPWVPLPPPTSLSSSLEALPSLAMLHQLALANRQDLAALGAQIRAEEVSLALAQKDYYPDMEVFGRYDTFWQPSSTQGDLRGQLGIRMNVPIHRERLRAGYSEVEFRLSQRRAEYQQRMLDISYEVQSTFEQLRESQRIVELYQNRLLPLAHQNLAAARAGYETGKSSFLELITAQRRLLEVQQMHQEALTNLHRRKAALDRFVATQVQSGPGG